MFRLYRRFNQWLARLITDGVATMECAYLFAALAIYGFPGMHASPAALVQWFSQTFIQLVMLAILAVQGKHHKHEIARLHEKIDAQAPRAKPARANVERLRDPKSGRFLPAGSKV